MLCKGIFKKYLTYKQDTFDLLLYTLNSMVKDKTTILFSRQRRPAIEVNKSDFEQRARDLQISNCEPFYRSKLFIDAHFSVDQDRRLIIKRYETE